MDIDSLGNRGGGSSLKGRPCHITRFSNESFQIFICIPHSTGCATGPTVLGRSPPTGKIHLLWRCAHNLRRILLRPLHHAPLGAFGPDRTTAYRRYKLRACERASSVGSPTSRDARDMLRRGRFMEAKYEIYVNTEVVGEWALFRR